MKKWVIALLSLACSLPLSAGQFKNIKDVEVHYSAFNSTFLTADVAHQYKLKRNGYTAIINISVLDNSKAGKPATSATVTGTSKNLIGNIRQLEFREVKEGNAIYYLAELPINNEEVLTFELDVDSGISGKGKLKFNQKFYVED